MENTAKVYDANDDPDELALCGVVYELGSPNSSTVSLCKRCNGSHDRCFWYLDGPRKQGITMSKWDMHDRTTEEQAKQNKEKQDATGTNRTSIKPS